MSAATTVEIPADLMHGDGPSKIVDKYSIVTDSEIGIGGNGSFDVPIVQIPHSGPKDHGGSFGCDATKPFTTIVKSPNGTFVMGDISLVDPARLKAIGLETKKRFDNMGNRETRQNNHSQILADSFERHFACIMPDGSKLKHLNTWVNDGKDPFGRTVTLPPPIEAMPRKAAKQMDYFGHTNPGFGNPPPPGHPGHAPSFNPGQMFGPATNHTQHPAHNSYFAATPFTAPPGHMPPPPPPMMQQQQQQQFHQNAPQQPVRPSIPPPDKTVIFHMGSGNINSSFHVAETIRQQTVIGGQAQENVFIVLVRNKNAPGASESFTPETPAQGYKLFISMPNSETFQVHMVMLKYNIKAVEHIILLVTEPRPEPVPQPVMPEGATMAEDIGTAALPLTQEDAATGFDS